MPRVSVVVPLYNKRQTILRTLMSLQRQTLSDFEVIVVDDGSTDGGELLAADFADERFRMIAQVNAGPGAARNAGARVAKSDLLAFLDADDEWMPDFLADMVAVLDASKAAQAATSGYYEYPSGKSSESLWRSRGLRDGVVEVTPRTSVTEFLYLLRFMAAWSTVIRRNEFLRLNGFHERTRSLYGEDTCLWMKLLTNAPVAIDLKPRVKFHRENSALSGNASGARAVEPFLVDPQEVLSTCPESLRPLLEDVIQARSLKTACMLGFWGQWREAASIRRRFWNVGAFRHRHAIPAVIAGTPFAGVGGYLWRQTLGVPRSRAA
jgi:hypothetical protein